MRLMKLFLTKRRVFLFLFLAALAMQVSACTYTPWHQEQAEIFLKRGISFISIEQYNNALKELLEAEKYAPDNQKIHYYLGMAYHGKGMKDRAMEEFKKAIALQDDYSEAHNYLGTLYSDMELWDKAIEEFDKALANPVYDTPAMALYNAGWAYYAKKDYKTSLAKYREALSREPITILRPQIEKHIGQCQNCRIMIDTMKQTVVLCRDGIDEKLPEHMESRLKDILKQRWDKHFLNP